MGLACSRHPGKVFDARLWRNLASQLWLKAPSPPGDRVCDGVEWSDEFLVWKGCEDLFWSWTFVDYTYIWKIYLIVYVYIQHIQTLELITKYEYASGIDIHIYVQTYMHMISTVYRRAQHNLNSIGLSVYFTFGINTFLAMGFVVYFSPCKIFLH